MHTLDPALATSLDRFLLAQDPVLETVLNELREGQKKTHWMWFIFPQLQGLGRSSMSDYFGLSDVKEARAFLAHETLGPRLRQCTEILLTTGSKTAQQVFASPDDLKFGSSMTLFAALAEDHSPFHEARTKYFAANSVAQTKIQNEL